MDNEKLEKMFLSESYKDSINFYRQLLLKKKDSLWDIIVISASNSKQKLRFEKELNTRIKKRLIPKSCKYYVISDPQGLRVGSGGATLNILIKLNEKVDNLLDKKVLLIHSGGDSKRIPQYSVKGKLFAPVPKENFINKCSTIFDEIMVSYAGIPARMESGFFIVCGDILPIFNELQIDFQYKKCCILTMKETIETGEHHGVVCTNAEEVVTKFLHKFSKEKLINNNAVNNGKVDLDIGSIFFNKEIIKDLLKISVNNKKILISKDSCLNFYGDFLYPLCLDSTKKEYLKQSGEIKINQNVIKAKTILWDVLNKYKLTNIRINPSEFLHFGTTMEFYNFMKIGNTRKKYYNWKNIINSVVTDRYKGTFINAAIINSKINGKCYVENSLIKNSTIGNNCIITNCIIVNNTIPNNIVLNTEKVENGYITRFFSIYDNPKDELRKSSLFKKIVKDVDMDFSNSLWNCELYVIEDTTEKSVNTALKIINAIDQNDTIYLKKWLLKRRMSLCSSFNRADYNIKIDEILEAVEKEKIIEELNSQVEITNIISYVNTSINKTKLIEFIKNCISVSNFKTKNRIYYFLYLIENDEKYFKMLFNNIRDEVYHFFKVDMTKCNYNNVTDKVFVENPIRINFGGAWTDTPPYCIEHGGKVLNIAFKLNNDLPVKVTVKKIESQQIIITMKDLNLSTTISNINQIKNCGNPNDPFALIKAAIYIIGVIRDEDTSLQDCFDRIKNGFEIITDVRNIPRGSGLGTSSILSGTILQAFNSFYNLDLNKKDIYSLVLILEQVLSTGGGWQDQIGGLENGIKYISHQKNSNIIEIEKIVLPHNTIEELNKRLIIINTGQRRLARNLLREMVLKAINSNLDMMNLYKKIEDIGIKQVEALKNCDMDLFGKYCTNYWNCIRKLEPGSTNIFIDYLFETIEKYICGKSICGAGGGGFLVAILKKDFSKEDIIRELEIKFPDSHVKVWDLSIY